MATQQSQTQQRHLLVEGHVQGVSFRAYTEQRASELGLAAKVSLVRSETRPASGGFSGFSIR